MPRPAVWFEREVLPGLVADVEAKAAVLGPGTATPDDPFAALPGAAGIVAGAWEYGAATMDRAPELRVISRTGIGYDRVDVAAATARGIAVCNAPDGPTVSTAEHAVALLLAAAKSLFRSSAALRSGDPQPFGRHRAMELEGKVLGLVGFGRIARRVASAAAALGMTVKAFDPYVAHADFPMEVQPAATLAEVLDADAVSVHVPLSPETRGLIGKEEFAAMRPGAVFVNTARGGLVDQEALLAALDSGHLFAAGLDVTDPEPLPPDHPLLHRQDVIVTPHVASATAEGKARMFRTAFDQVLQVLQGERPDHLVNPEVWARSGAP